MKKALIFGLILSIALFSCKTYRNVENLDPSIPIDQRTDSFDLKSLEKLVEGDQIIIKSKDSKLYYAHFKLVQKGILFGTLWKEDSKKLHSAQRFQLDVNEIENLKVYRGAPSATVSLVVVCAAALAFGILLIGLALDPIALN